MTTESLKQSRQYKYYVEPSMVTELTRKTLVRISRQTPDARRCVRVIAANVLDMDVPKDRGLTAV